MKKLFIATLAVALLCASPATAGQQHDTVNVSASVNKNCQVTAAALSFGQYDPVVANATADLDATTTIVLKCTKGSTGVSLDLGTSVNAPAGCTSPQRCMQDGTSGNYLDYQLYSDSARSSAWTSPVTEDVSGGPPSPSTITVYGRIPGGQNATAGTSYADAIVATVSY